jgi:hypothetical protein
MKAASDRNYGQLSGLEYGHDASRPRLQAGRSESELRAGFEVRSDFRFRVTDLLSRAPVWHLVTRSVLEAARRAAASKNATLFV